MIALSNAFRSHPGVGWVRAGNIDQSTAVKLKQLEYENHILKSEILELKSQLAVEDLALDDHLFLFEIVLEYFGRRGSQERKIKLSWAEIFSIIAPIMKMDTDVRLVRQRFSSIIASVIRNEEDGIGLSEVSDKSFETIISYFIRCSFLELVNDRVVIVTRLGNRFINEYKILLKK
ncbi:hypothetical protein MKK68_16555 [Methylobacterium sp. E-016]|uniref:hypothetical protein n=1 Tax=Methylobacterium sp. E-016 TaxID=2836556 RepID=UPI001FBB1FD1|nr:hypothetical protein [Methylobacterium sp. E-016]MCJ2077238.1 hypothetical protein [Methylobacterium sp. E-016]